MMDKLDRLEEVRCPKCGRLVCKAEEKADLTGIHFWCNRCKEEVIINKK